MFEQHMILIFNLLSYPSSFLHVEICDDVILMVTTYNDLSSVGSRGRLPVAESALVVFKILFGIFHSNRDN